MTIQTAGIHHITAFAGDPQANVDFYAGVLGLRLVKKQSTSMHLMYIICILAMSTEAQVPSLPSSHPLDHHGENWWRSGRHHFLCHSSWVNWLLAESAGTV